MADILTMPTDPPEYTVSLTRTEAAVVLLSVSLAARLTVLPKFTLETAAALVEAMRPVVMPSGTLMGELYDLLAPGEDLAGTTP